MLAIAQQLRECSGDLIGIGRIDQLSGNSIPNGVDNAGDPSPDDR